MPQVAVFHVTPQAVPILGSVLHLEQLFVQFQQPAHIILQHQGAVLGQISVVLVRVFRRSVAMYADVRDRGVPVLLHNIDSTKYLLQFLRIVAVVRIKGRFVDGKIQIGLAFLMPFFPRFGLRADVSHAVIAQPLQHGRVLVQQVAATAKVLGQHDVGVFHPAFVRQHPGVMYRLFLAVPAAYHHRVPGKVLAGEPLVGYLLSTPVHHHGRHLPDIATPLDQRSEYEADIGRQLQVVQPQIHIHDQITPGPLHLQVFQAHRISRHAYGPVLRAGRDCHTGHTYI